MSGLIDWLKSPAPDWVPYVVMSLYAAMAIYGLIRTIRYHRKRKERRAMWNTSIFSIDDEFSPHIPTTMPDISHLTKPKVASAGIFDGKDIEFGVGSVMGTRSFNVDDLGYLTGVVHEDRWLPGENVCTCHADGSILFPPLTDLYYYRSDKNGKLAEYIMANRGKPKAYVLDEPIRIEYFQDPTAEVRPVKYKEFQPGAPGDPEYDKLYGEIVESTKRIETIYDLAEQHRKNKHSIDGCTCGFYGYYEGSNDYYKSGMVMAVVKASGELVLGSRGFRAEKAEIVALHIPPEIDVVTHGMLHENRHISDKIVQTYPDVPRFPSFEKMVAEFPPTGDID